MTNTKSIRFDAIANDDPAFCGAEPLGRNRPAMIAGMIVDGDENVPAVVALFRNDYDLVLEIRTEDACFARYWRGASVLTLRSVQEILLPLLRERMTTTELQTLGFVSV